MIPVLALWLKFRDYVTIGLGVTTLIAGGMYYVTDLRLEACEASKESLVARYDTALAEATLKAEQDKTRIEEEYTRRAEEADSELSDLLARYNSSLVRYANRSTPSGPAPTPEGGSPAGVDRPSTSPVVPNDLITIPFVDAEICAENTARLQIAREWAIGLQEVE